MFRLHKHRSDKFGEKFDFRFSSFNALQVPKGWDRLSLSLITAGTGKTIAKSGKASARNGTCRWTETFSDSIWIPQVNASKETDEYIIKFVVGMGSSKSSILGEASINLASYMSSKSSVPISLPLKKCNSGTVLQLKVQCLTPRAKPRDENWKDANSDMEDTNIEYDEIENKSDVSDGIFTRSRGSSSSNNLDSASQAEPCSRNISFSPTGSRNSFDSVEGSIGRDNYSPRSNSSGISINLVGRQDSISSQSSSHYGSYSFHDASRSNQTSFNSKASGYGSHSQNQDDLKVPRPIASSPLRNTGSSKDLLEATEVKIEELHAEAKMWEQNARKLMIDLEKLQKESLDQSTHQENLEKELAASHAECAGLKLEIKQLKVLVEESKQATATENLKFHTKDTNNMQQQLEDEIKFQKESNANLAVQLKKTQESNIELLSLLQELEETIGKQKMEIDNLSDRKLEDSNQVSAKKKKDTSCDSEVEDREISTETKQEESRNMELELQHLQELQKNMASTIQFLEISLEEKNYEIETERSLKAQALMECEATWRATVAEKENRIVDLEAKLSEDLNSGHLKEIGSGDDNKDNLIKEIDNLKQKVQELERDCNELTDENLELLFKLKESEKDLTDNVVSESLSHDCAANSFRFTSESEESKLKYQFCKNEEDLKIKNAFTEGCASDHLQVQPADGNTSNDLQLQLQAFKEKASFLDDELCKCRSRVEEQESTIATLQLELNRGKGIESKDNSAAVCSELRISESEASIKMSKLLSQLDNQVQLSLSYLRQQQHSLESSTNIGCNHVSGKSDIFRSACLVTQEGQAESILNGSIRLRKLLEAKLTMGVGELQSMNEVQNDLPSHDIYENVPVTYTEGLENSLVELESEVTGAGGELLEKKSKAEKLRSKSLLKKEEAGALTHCQMELNTRTSDLQNEKCEPEESTEIMVSKSTITSKRLDDLQNEVRVLNKNLDAQVSANKILEKKSSELEISKRELELHLHELEKENVQLSGRICGLEAQLRYLTDEKESSRLELENSGTHAVKLQDEVRRMEVEMETQKTEMKQKLQDMQKRWLAVQEECEYLKIANPKLQATVEGLIEECSSLQKSNAELRNQKMKLHEQCAILEAELGESENGFSDMSRKVEALEEKYSSLLEEIASKEKALNLELDALLQDNQKHKLALEDGLSHQIYLERTAEVENPLVEVAHLTGRIYETSGEKEKTPEDDKVLKTTTEELQRKLKISESKLETLQIDSQAKLQQLSDELATARQNQEVLMADHEKLLDMLEDVKSNEEKHKSSTRGFELKLKASDYGRSLLAEEISSLKVQLEKTAQLQDELLALTSSLNEAKLEKERIEASFQILSADYEQLQSERISLLEKISTCEKALSELDDCKRRKIALQEKVLRLEGDLTAREALGSQEAVLKNELAQIRRENSQLQRKIKNLEEEKDEFIKRAQTLEDELKQMREVKQDLSESAGHIPHSSSNSTATSIHNGSILPLDEQERNIEHISKQPILGSDLLQLLLDGQNRSKVDDNQRQFQVENKQDLDLACSKDALSKIQALETELAEALEANDMYKTQLKSLLSGELSSLSGTKAKLAEGGEESRHDWDKSALEAELKDLRERYFHMSLKYAEVEDEREQLVMKLKAANTGRRWFS